MSKAESLSQAIPVNAVGVPIQASLIQSADGYYDATPSAPLPTATINVAGAKRYLTAQNWPEGLQNTLIQNLLKQPYRFFICDDSASMMNNDGKKLVGLHPQTKLISCSRWTELVDSLKFHIEFAEAASAVSEFRFLNMGRPVTIGTNDAESNRGVSTLMNSLNSSPSGKTPLCRHIREVTQKIKDLMPQLVSMSQRACLIISTDGESSDGDIRDAMRPLMGLPVWVVVRLCTNESRIVEYWNRLDNELELELEVLDDLSGEAREIFYKNYWLTYGEPLQRMREFGTNLKEIDLLDENRLSSEQMKAVITMILGGEAQSLPYPEENWDRFIEVVTALNDAQPQTWCPIKKKLQPWIKMNKLRNMYKPQTRICNIL